MNGPPEIPYDVKDLSLAEEGVRRIEWAAREMPVIGRSASASRGRQAAEGPAPRGLPARHHGDREPHARARDGGAELALCA